MDVNSRTRAEIAPPNGAPALHDVLITKLMAAVAGGLLVLAVAVLVLRVLI